MRASTYTQRLRDLIQECLYEKPIHCPDVIELKPRISKGLCTALHSKPMPEPWIDFLPAEPIPPEIVNLPALPDGAGSKTSKKKDPGTES